MMGTWFLASFFGNYAAGFLGGYWEQIPKEIFFFMIAVIGLVAGLMILMIQKPLKRAVGPRHTM